MAGINWGFFSIDYLQKLVTSHGKADWPVEIEECIKVNILLPSIKYKTIKRSEFILQIGCSNFFFKFRIIKIFLTKRFAIVLQHGKVNYQ